MLILDLLKPLNCRYLCDMRASTVNCLSVNVTTSPLGRLFHIINGGEITDIYSLFTVPFGD